MIRIIWFICFLSLWNRVNTTCMYPKNNYVEVEVATENMLDQWGNYREETSERPIMENRITDSTIVCSNMDSTLTFTAHFEMKDTYDYEQILKITNSAIPTFPPTSLTIFPKVTKLDLSNNFIEEILPGAFTGLNKIKELRLNRNKLIEITQGLFNSLNYLEILDLSNNNIQQLEEYSLMGLVSLQELYLNNNNIVLLEKKLFISQKSLEILDISSNPLKSLNGVYFPNLQRLSLNKTNLHQFDTNLENVTISVFDLSSNYLSKIDFKLLPTVHNIDLANNKITEVENLDTLEASALNLNNNSVSEIGYLGLINTVLLQHNNLKTLEPDDLHLLNTLLIRILDVSFNSISHIDENAFRGFSYLNKLFLHHNNITTIHPLCFHSLINLSILDLSHNQIHHLQYGIFNKLENLKILDISNNRLTSLQQYTLSTLAILEHLNFDNNQIATINISDLTHYLVHLKSISLRNNSFSCEDLVKIFHHVNRPYFTLLPGTAYDVENFQGIACVNKITDGKSFEDFFNSGFKNANFFKYFERDYAHSNFFKHLNNFIAGADNFSALRPQQFIGTNKNKDFIQDTPSPILAIIMVFLGIISFMLLGMIMLTLNLVKIVGKSNVLATVHREMTNPSV